MNLIIRSQRVRRRRAPTPTARVPEARVRLDGKYFARNGQKLVVRGVTYGPFAPNSDADPFPEPEVAREDFARMREAGFNAVRTYHMPPALLFEMAQEQGISLFVDVPWRKHVCFLESRAARREARRAVVKAARAGRRHANLLAYSIGNEIPPDIIRWFGARRIERFLNELSDEVKQIDPDGLVTYASFPPTEYLDLSFLDFVTFNVYLHDRETFRRYLLRLQNAVGDKPLVLSELGMDTLRHGEQAQANFLAGHLRELRLMGLAGSFVFSWTDEWFTGGHPISDWAFGITYKDRTPKPSYHALQVLHECSLPSLLPKRPRVSVVVCTYNGGRTLEQCLRSLQSLDYPDCEIIVVDDGSTDNTREILARFPRVRAWHQENRGLSVARNIGLQMATGSIVAYTDSDCFADPDWLTHLVYQLERTDAAAVGGPNLTPADGWLAACVAASPGQPTHVLESDQQAEHVPGCNMAFRREALEQINGFDPQFRTAGDDVDVCWRLQHAGHWISFAPGAFVWHHRRQGPRSYLKQQAGYGQAEGLLHFKHPEQFNCRGESKWRGVLYGAGLNGIRLRRNLIYQGTFGSGMFQCLYQPAAAHWAMLPATLEWHLLAGSMALAGIAWPLLWVVALAMILLSLAVTALQAWQARLERQHDHLASRVVIWGLCYVQPLVRSCHRYRTRWFSFPRTIEACESLARFPLLGHQSVAYWNESGRDRMELLTRVIDTLSRQGLGKVVDSGWNPWDLQIHSHYFTHVRIYTTQENHGGSKRLIRVRYQMRFGDAAIVVGGLALAALVPVAVFSPWAAAAAVGGMLGAAAAVWWRGTWLAGQAITVLHRSAGEMGMTSCEPDAEAPANPE